MELAGQQKVGQALKRAKEKHKRPDFGAETKSGDRSIDYIGIVALAGLSFLLGRVSVLDAILPCGIAFLAAMIYLDSLRFYYVPAVLAGMATNLFLRFDIWGDAVALMVVAFLILILKKRHGTLLQVALAAGAATFAVKVGYYIFIDMFFLYDLVMNLTQAILIIFLVFAFHSFLRLMNGAQRQQTASLEGIVSLTLIAVMAAGGLGISGYIWIQPVEAVSMLVTMWIGHRLGIAEGAIAGLTAGMALFLINAASPALAGVFGLAGMVAGILQSRHRVVAGLSFTAITLLFGISKGYPELYVSAYDVLLALALFLVAPINVINKVNDRLDRIGNGSEQRGRQMALQMADHLQRYTDAYDHLSLLYGRTREPISYQFQGIAKALQRMGEELSVRPREKADEAKFTIKTGFSSYAKWGISGDSHICAPINRSEYLIALSDGMGKGEVASAESMLTTSTLYHLIRAGFSVELALKAIHSIKISKTEEEMFSTVDLGFIDLESGKLRLYKIGAAATFLKRGTKVSAIKVSALPLGIVDQIKIDDVVFQMKKGDEIIMVSDGITEAGGSADSLDWLEETIANVKSKDPQTMSDLVINKAVERYGLREKDDMTVITAMIN